VRALFDELPTPHLVVEITPFPAGPLTENDYLKAEKLERILRSGANIWTLLAVFYYVSKSRTCTYSTMSYDAECSNV